MDKEPFENEEWVQALNMICESKAEEMRLIGYEQVTADDIWRCVSSKYEKTGIPPLHKLVNDVLSLKATALMNYMTIAAYKGSPFQY
ncbi:hypothetical protein JJQ72_05395 [Paenibacillus sp. F411]|uniref:Post-transcriptional regulator n=1 Tax=Paenibacillus algicola TaxID=2565926 RepID=A0A4P8XI76_9BACL|nr:MULTISPECIES: post-transcriptional regulator [Paenibacillus]MBO2943418.1 hypothetical protein [Paenibacillus sp. F411]QCT02008.1 hypothetical protein E6C60_1292 [Paenibacillus algicola]